MKKNIFTESIKKLIDLSFAPLKKNKTFLSYLFDHTLRNEMEERSEKGELFPHHHIYRSIRLAKKLLNQKFIILDIGGGIGATAKLFNQFFPENKIIVFEPINDNFDAIKIRFSATTNIEIIKCAAGNENSVKKINIANRITSSSILPLAADLNSTVFNDKNLGQVRDECIEIVRLDDFMLNDHNEIGILKIDVQGFELDVLKGAEVTLKRTDVIVLEANNHDGYVGSPKYYDIDDFLREHNFTLYDILPSIVDNGKLKEWDLIYLNNLAQCVSV
jgi:FkbM family methyltransferase